MSSVSSSLHDREPVAAVVDADAHRGEVPLHERECLKDLRRRLDLIYKDRLDGRITEKQYEDHKQGLEKDVMEVEAKIEGLNRADFKFYDKGVELLELVQRAVNAWESSDQSQKRVLLETVHSNCLWDGERVIPSTASCSCLRSAHPRPEAPRTRTAWAPTSIR